MKSKTKNVIKVIGVDFFFRTICIIGGNLTHIFGWSSPISVSITVSLLCKGLDLTETTSSSALERNYILSFPSSLGVSSLGTNGGEGDGSSKSSSWLLNAYTLLLFLS